MTDIRCAISRELPRVAERPWSADGSSVTSAIQSISIKSCTLSTKTIWSDFAMCQRGDKSNMPITGGWWIFLGREWNVHATHALESRTCRNWSDPRKRPDECTSIFTQLLPNLLSRLRVFRLDARNHEMRRYKCTVMWLALSPSSKIVLGRSMRMELDGSGNKCAEGFSAIRRWHG